MNRRTAAAHLREITALEGMQIEDRALSYIAEAADGSMRDALSLLDQCAAYHYGEMLTYDHVLEILGAADTGVYSMLYGQVVRGEIEEALKTVNDLVNAGSDVSQLINDFIWYMRTVLLAGSAASADILDISEEKLMLARADAELTDRQDLIMIMSALAELGNRSRFSTQKRVLLEVELIRLCTRHTAAEPVERSVEAVQAPMAAAAPRVTGQEAQPEAADIRPSAPAGTGSLRARLEAERNKTMASGGNTGNYASPSPVQERPPAPLSAKITVDLKDPDPERIRRETADGTAGLADAAQPKTEAAPAAEQTVTAEASGDRLIDVLRHNWADMVSELSPSNRTLFSGVMLKEEKNGIVLLFKNKINYTLAARNPEENGVLRLRELAKERLGVPVGFNARIAKPGEIEAVDNRMTDEELGRIQFKVEFED